MKVEKENLPHSRRPFSFVNDDNIRKVKETVLENSGVSIKEIAEDLSISCGSTRHDLVNVLGMKRVNVGHVPQDQAP